MNPKPKYCPASDVFTKVYFTKKTNRLKSLVAATLDIDETSITDFSLTTTEKAADSTGGKFCRLDLSCKVDGRIVDIEVQRGVTDSFRKRATFCAAKLYSEALDQGKGYDAIPDTILISILDESLFKNDPYYRSEFVLSERARGEVLTESLILIFYELEKLATLDTNNKQLTFWLKLLAAKTTKQLDILAEEGDAEMALIVEEVKEVLKDKDYRELERKRCESIAIERLEKNESFNEGKAIGVAQGHAEGRTEERAAMVTTMAANGMSSAAIADLTDLQLAEVEQILAARR